MNLPIKFTEAEMLKAYQDIQYLHKHGIWENDVPEWAAKVDKGVYRDTASTHHLEGYMLCCIAEQWYEDKKNGPALDPEQEFTPSQKRYLQQLLTASKES